MQRVSKDQYYLDIAKSVTERSTCLRRNYGAIIVKDDEVISTGYNGAPRGEVNCCECGFCQREAMDIPRANDTSYASLSTPRPMPSSPLPGGT